MKDHLSSIYVFFDPKFKDLHQRLFKYSDELCLICFFHKKKFIYLLKKSSVMEKSRMYEYASVCVLTTS